MVFNINLIAFELIGFKVSYSVVFLKKFISFYFEPWFEIFLALGQSCLSVTM